MDHRALWLLHPTAKRQCGNVLKQEPVRTVVVAVLCMACSCQPLDHDDWGMHFG